MPLPLMAHGSQWFKLADCTQKHNPDFITKANQREQQLDNEYQSLMAELGEGTRGGGPRGGAVSTPQNQSCKIILKPNVMLNQGHYGPSRGSRGGNAAPWANQSGSGSPMSGGGSNNSPLPPWVRSWMVSVGCFIFD